jgi:endonuclease VIII-like 1
MPEIAEVRIMSEYVNHHSKDKTFKKIYHVEKGNNPIDSNLIENFKVESNSNGKELVLRVYHDVADLKFSVFMGMSGNWKWVPTEKWNDTKYIRMRLDSTDGYSLLLYGSYMGPKYRLGGFTGVKRGPDPTKEFDKFKKNIIDNLHNKVFDKPICEAILDQRYFNGIGAYLTSEIIGRLNINPFKKIKDFNSYELDNLFNVILKCCNESYEFGGGELVDWKNPFGKSRIDEWILFYNNKYICYKQKFGKRNIWIQKKFK